MLFPLCCLIHGLELDLSAGLYGGDEYGKRIEPALHLSPGWLVLSKVKEGVSSFFLT